MKTDLRVFSEETSLKQDSLSNLTENTSKRRTRENHTISLVSRKYRFRDQNGKFSVAVLLIAASMIITLIACVPALVTKHRFSFHRWCDQFLEE